MDQQLLQNIDRWEEIKSKCPNLFRNGIVFECGHGWTNIIHDLSIKIETILEKYPENEMFCVQVKEKYGTLRFYMSCETDKITDLIHETEALSSQTCEACGAVAKMRGKHWLEVKCDDCFK